MKNKALLMLTMVLMLILGVTPGIHAEEAEGDESTDLSISGFVDTSYYYDLNVEAGGFSLDAAKIILDKQLSSYASAYARLGFYNPSTDIVAGEIEVSEAFVTLTAPVGSGLDFMIGKFYAPVGFESVDAPDMYQYSHALVFDYGIPLFFTGVMASYSFGDLASLGLYITNGWDANSNENGEYTAGMRLGLSPLEGLGIGVSAIYGSESEDAGNQRTMLDVDLAFDYVENLMIGAEFNMGSEEGAIASAAPGEDPDDATWNGFLVMAHYDFTDWFGLTVRYDMFNDPDDFRIGDGVPDGQTRTAIAVAPTFSIADGAGALIEYRMDMSDEEVFTDSEGEATDTSSYVVVEFTYSF
jgi:Putative beta-barrel porin-2, OmpL-like. bbp2